MLLNLRFALYQFFQSLRSLRLRFTDFIFIFCTICAFAFSILFLLAQFALAH